MAKRKRIRPRRPPGRSANVPGTEKQRAHSRVAALKTGMYARSVTPEQATRLALERKNPGAGEVIDAYANAIARADTSGVDHLAVIALSDLELMRRGLIADVRKHGGTLRECIVDPVTGRVIGERLRLHPAVEPSIKISETLGFTSKSRQLDPAARGEGARDEAIAAHLRRDERLWAMPKDAMPGPADEDPILDSEVVGLPAPAKK